MSSTNLGDQYITFDYHHPAKASEFNTLLRGAINPGIYSGGAITYTGSSAVATIAPFVAYLKTDEAGSNKLVRVETRTNTLITVAIGTPVLSITYTWSDIENNWLDFHQRATGSSAIAYEVCLGEVTFSGANINGVIYTGKTWGTQLVSDVPVGVAPMSIISTTKVNNLNVEMVDGYHAGAPVYDYIVDSPAAWVTLYSSPTWLGVKNVLITTNIARTAQTTIPPTVE